MWGFDPKFYGSVVVPDGKQQKCAGLYFSTFSSTPAAEGLYFILRRLYNSTA